MRDILYFFARKALRVHEEIPPGNETLQGSIGQSPEELDSLLGEGACSLLEEAQKSYGPRLTWRVHYRGELNSEKLFLWSLTWSKAVETASPCAFGASLHTDGLIGHIQVCSKREADQMWRELLRRKYAGVETALHILEECLLPPEKGGNGALRKVRIAGDIEKILDVAALEEL